MCLTDYIEYEDKLTAIVSYQLECTRGDAQGVLEVHAHEVLECFNAKLLPRAAFDKIWSV